MANALARVPEWQRRMGRLMGVHARLFLPIPSDL